MKESISSKLAKQIIIDYQHVGELPSERALAEHYACTRRTIRTALSELQQTGQLCSDARRGHRITNTTVSPTQIETTTRKIWNIVMLVGATQLDDQNFLDLIGGAVSAAGKHNVNLIIREMPASSSCPEALKPELLHQGIEADAYFLTRATDRLKNFLENQFKPCVVLGVVPAIEAVERRRFTQVLLPQTEKACLVLEYLLNLGHRKILYVDWLYDLQYLEDFARKKCNQECFLSSVKTSSISDSSKVRRGNASKVFEVLHDHTAIVIHAGGATHYNIYRQLAATSVEIPKRLSIVIDSGRFDWLTSVYEVSGVFSSASEEGKNSIDELVEQLKSGALSFGNRFSSFKFMYGKTIASAMSSDDVIRYDAINPWKDKLKVLS